MKPGQSCFILVIESSSAPSHGATVRMCLFMSFLSDHVDHINKLVNQDSCHAFFTPAMHIVDKLTVIDGGRRSDST